MTEQRIATGVVHDVPVDLREALSADPDALDRWNDLTPLARNEWICWTISAKKAETRANHIERVCSELKGGSVGPAAGLAVRIGRWRFPPRYPARSVLPPPALNMEKLIIFVAFADKI